MENKTNNEKLDIILVFLNENNSGYFIELPDIRDILNIRDFFKTQTMFGRYEINSIIGKLVRDGYVERRLANPRGYSDYKITTNGSAFLKNNNGYSSKAYGNIN